MRPMAFLMCVAAISALGITQSEMKTLDIYLVDVEGGNATLVVSPSGESLLIDTGNVKAAARDADRIMAAVKDAGLQQIDHLVTTHWHLDHFGAMENLARRIPTREFIDHGANVQRNAHADGFLLQTYPHLYAKAKHLVVKPGDEIPITGLHVNVVTSAGDAITTALPGAGAPNPYCARFEPQEVDRGENAQSIGSVITYGKFRALHLGDLTVNKEFELMCPVNRIGVFDLFVVSHHGQPTSNAPVLVHAIEPRVAIMNNGTRKGGQPEVMKVIHSAPGLEDLWQLHFSELSGQEYTVPGMFITNRTDEPLRAMPVDPMPAGSPAPPHDGPAYWIKVSARADGSFSVTNQRNGFSKTYRTRSY